MRRTALSRWLPPGSTARDYPGHPFISRPMEPPAGCSKRSFHRAVSAPDTGGVRGCGSPQNAPECPHQARRPTPTALENGPSWLHFQSRRPGEAHTAAQPLTKHCNCVSLAALAKMHCGIMPPRSQGSSVIIGPSRRGGAGFTRATHPFRCYLGRHTATSSTISLSELTPFTVELSGHSLASNAAMVG